MKTCEACGRTIKDFEISVDICEECFDKPLEEKLLKLAKKKVREEKDHEGRHWCLTLGAKIKEVAYTKNRKESGF